LEKQFASAMGPEEVSCVTVRVSGVVPGVNENTQMPWLVRRWTWSECRSELFVPSRRGLRVGLLGGLVTGLIIWLALTRGTGLAGFGAGLSFMIVSGLGVGLLSVGLVIALIVALGPPTRRLIK
jgi:hypothetical protein